MNDQTALNQIFQYVYNNAITKADAGNIQEALNDVKLLNDQTALHQISQHIYSNAIAKVNAGNIQEALNDIKLMNDQTALNQISQYVYNNAITKADAGNIQGALNDVSLLGDQVKINQIGQHIYNNAISMANAGRFNDSINYISKVNNQFLINDVTNIVKVLKLNGNYKYINKTSKYGLKFNTFYDNINDTYINIQENYNYQNNKAHLDFDQILSIYVKLSNKSPKIFKNVNEFTITDIINPKDILYGKLYGDGFTSKAEGADGIIRLFKYADDPEYAIMHEAAHDADIKDNVQFGISNSIEWENAFKADGKGGVTKYANDSLNRKNNKYAEDFAESIALVQKNSKLFEANYPNRSAIIKRLFPELY